jgi:SNF2 family DNA or RNA helicase
MENLDIAMQNERVAIDKKKGGNFDVHEFRKQRIENFLIQTSGKMVLIDKLLPKLKAEGHKVSTKTCVQYVLYICMYDKRERTCC